MAWLVALLIAGSIYTLYSSVNYELASEELEKNIQELKEKDGPSDLDTLALTSIFEKRRRYSFSLTVGLVGTCMGVICFGSKFNWNIVITFVVAFIYMMFLGLLSIMVISPYLKSRPNSKSGPDKQSGFFIPRNSLQ